MPAVQKKTKQKKEKKTPIKISGKELQKHKPA